MSIESIINALQCKGQADPRCDACSDKGDGQPLKVCIVGGSLCGLAAANVLHRLGASVTVFEKQPSSFESRGACLGFVDVELWERIRGARMTWPDGKDVTRTPPPDGRQSFERQGSFYYGDCWTYLYSGLPDGTVKFGYTVETLGDPERPTVDGEDFDVAVVADGGWSSLRGLYFKDDPTPEYSGYQIFWGRVDTHECGSDLLTSFDGRTELIGPYAAVTLPVPCFNGDRKYMCAWFIPTPEDEIRQPQSRGDNRQMEQTSGHGAAPEWFLPFVRALFGERADTDRKRSPGTKSAADEIVKFAEAAARKGKITASPVYEFGASKSVVGRIVLMGDAAHMASPMTAAGAHVGMKDALALMRVFAGGVRDIDGALREYDRGGVKRTKDLLRTSRAVSSDLVPRQGKHAVKSPTTLLSQNHTATTCATIGTAPQVLRLV